MYFFSYAGDANLKIKISKLEAGIKSLHIRGTVRVVFRPLLNTPPFLGGMRLYLLNKPVSVTATEQCVLAWSRMLRLLRFDSAHSLTRDLSSCYFYTSTPPPKVSPDNEGSRYGTFQGFSNNVFSGDSIAACSGILLNQPIKFYLDHILLKSEYGY